MQITLIHLVFLVITLTSVILLGLYSSRKIKSAEDFSLGGRSSSTAMVAGTIAGTAIGGASTIGTAQLAYSVGLSAWWFTLGVGLGCLTILLFYARPLRKYKLDTVPQYLALHYGKSAGPFSSIVATLGIFFSIVASSLSAMHLLSAIFNISPALSAFITTFITVGYVFFGGVKGTGLIGIVKVAILYLTLLVGGYISYYGLGGFSGIHATFPPYPWFSMNVRGFWVDSGNLLSLIVGMLTTQTYIQALYAAKDVETARKGTLAATLVTIPVGLLVVLIGLFMHVQEPGITPIDALPLFVIHYLPSWLGGIALGGLLLTSIGSSAGLCLGVGTMFSHDIAVEIFKCRDSKTLLKINRSVVLLAAAGASLFSYCNLNSQVLQWNYLSMGLRGAGICIPFSLAVLYPGHLSSKWAIAAMVSGTIITISWKYFTASSLDPLFPGLFCSAGVCLVGMVYPRLSADKRV